jgi:Transposase DDE domain
MGWTANRRVYKIHLQTAEHLLGRLEHNTLSRRMKTEIDIPVHRTDRARHGVIDSTGVRVYGEGEWKTRQHGVSKRRTWRKLHLPLDEATGEILAVVASGSVHRIIKGHHSQYL